MTPPKTGGWLNTDNPAAYWREVPKSSNIRINVDFGFPKFNLGSFLLGNVTGTAMNLLTMWGASKLFGGSGTAYTGGSSFFGGNFTGFSGYTGYTGLGTGASLFGNGFGSSFSSGFNIDRTGYMGPSFGGGSTGFHTNGSSGSGSGNGSGNVNGGNGNGNGSGNVNGSSGSGSGDGSGKVNGSSGNGDGSGNVNGSSGNGNGNGTTNVTAESLLEIINNDNNATGRAYFSGGGRQETTGTIKVGVSGKSSVTEENANTNDSSGYPKYLTITDNKSKNEWTFTFVKVDNGAPVYKFSRDNSDLSKDDNSNLPNYEPDSNTENEYTLSINSNNRIELKTISQTAQAHVKKGGGS